MITSLLRVILQISLMCYLSHANTQINLPELPDTKDVVTCLPDTSAYIRISVGPKGRDYTDLQLAINNAKPGTLIVLDAGVTFTGGFVLPAKIPSSDWIIIMSSRMDLLAREESRISIQEKTDEINYPTQRDAMPKIVTTNLSGIPCFSTQANAHHYRLIGLEITADEKVLQSYGLVHLGDASSKQNSLNTIPHHFVIDRCFIHGHSFGQIMKFGIRLDCANAAVIDCNISDFHSIGFDAQAIAGINGPGPFVIVNNYLEASGENILFGGGQAYIQGLVPSDILIRQNYFFKPFSWKVGHTEYKGKHWTIKNLFELKTGKRILLDGNILENSWADLPTGQSGYAILLTIRTEGGASPQADVSDITISNNIIKNCGAGITLAGTDDGKGYVSKRIRIYNNLFENINGLRYGDLNVNGPNDGTFIKIGEPEDVVIDHNTILQSGPITWVYKIMKNFYFTNNICMSMSQTAGYQGIYGPGYSRGNATIMHYFPDILDQNKRFNKNVLIGDDPTKYSAFNVISRNYFPPSVNECGFRDFVNGSVDYHNYKLSVNSPYYNSANDNQDIGVNFNRIDSALRQSRCNPIVTVVNKTSGGNASIRVFPIPTTELLSIHAPQFLFSRFQIFELSGRSVFSGICKSPTFELSVRDYLPGVYFFICKGEVIKFLVEK